MNDWLDIMLEEIDRKKKEEQEAKDESERRLGTQSQLGQIQEEDSNRT